MLTLFLSIAFMQTASVALKNNQTVNIDGCIFIAAFLADTFMVLAGLYIVFVIGPAQA
jgi:hypothetical protein